MSDSRPWDACNGDPCTCPGVPTPVQRLREALELIDENGCETFTRSSGSRCLDAFSGRTRGARYGADAWCAPCIARAALDAVVVQR